MEDRVLLVPLWQRALILLSTTVVGLVIMLVLQWGRPVLIPIALAVLLTFLLNPVVRALQRRGCGRVFSVMITVSAAGIILICFGWVVTRQIGGMVAEIPHNTDRIKAKVKTLRELGTGPLADQFSQMIEEISQEVKVPSNGDVATEKEPRKHEDSRSESPAETVILRNDSIPWLSLTGYLGSALEVLATLAFSLVLLVFFLLEREDLRDRVVMLAGKARLAFTSKALEDVTNRISRYIVMVAMVNGGFGIVLTAGLYLLQVPYPLLWGFLAAGLRFIPFIGAWVGAIFPIVMSMATSEGWWQPFAVLAYVAALELICGNVIEPLAFGRSIGVSPTALVVCAAFWLYLWGPIGLVLSAPFAVCLVVLGKNIPQLGFLNLLLGDTPALHTNLGIYQRFMLGDEHEAIRIIHHRMKETAADQTYDEMLIPTLNYTKRDVRREYLSEDDKQTVLIGIRQSLCQINCFHQTITANAIDQTARTPGDESTIASVAKAPVKILGCPAADDVDFVALEIFQQLLDPARWDLEIMAVEKTTLEIIAHITIDPPAIVCIASVPPGGMARTRYLCKRLRANSPEIKIIVGRWSPKRNRQVDRECLEQAGANLVTTTLLETRKVLEAQLKLIMGSSFRPQPHFRSRPKELGVGQLRDLPLNPGQD